MNHTDEKKSFEELQALCKKIRRQIITMIGEAKSGHPGGSLSAVEILVTLYYDVMKHDPANPAWEDRDRFLLSKGHGCPVLYATLAELGYTPADELNNLRKLGSIYQGHPDRRFIPALEASTGDRDAGEGRTVSEFVLTMDVERNSFFMIRLVVIPLALIVMLSWSVFWMERSSLGDRISVSFIGILTAVSYQILTAGIQPQIAYFTLFHGFLNLSLLIMCATVVVNLVVGALDRQGRTALGDRVDRRCRWIFPVIFFGLNLVMLVVAFLFF